MTLKTRNIAIMLLYLITYLGYWKVLFMDVSLVFSIIQCMAIVGVLLLAIKKRYIPVAYKGKFALVLILLLLLIRFVSGMQISSSIAQQRAMETVSTFFLMIVLFLLAEMLETDEIFTLSNVIIGLNTFAVLGYLVIEHQSIIYGFSQGLRLGDVRGNAIWTARFCGDAIVCCLFNFLKKSQLKYIFISLFLAVVSLLTGSKGPLVALIVVLCLFYLKEEINIKRKIVIILSSMILASILFIAFQNTTNVVIKYRFSLGTVTSDAPGYRADRYMFTLKSIMNNPVKGEGIGSWGESYWEQYKTETELTSDDYMDYPHNIILELTYEMGVWVTSLFLVSIIYLTINLKRNRENVILALLLINFLYAMFSGSVIAGNKGFYYWFAIGAGILCNKDTREQSMVLSWRN